MLENEEGKELGVMDREMSCWWGRMDGLELRKRRKTRAEHWMGMSAD